MAKQQDLIVRSSLTSTGLRLGILGKNYSIQYPQAIWNTTPSSLKQALLENLAFGNTHHLPLVLGGERIKYTTPIPLLESFLFRNQLGDMLNCENSDDVPPLTYMRQFYNLQFDFAPGDSTIPSDIPLFNSVSKSTAILPFTFGKESLATLALCLELGIKPTLMYSQEPTQPYEEAYKRTKLKEIEKLFGVETVFIKNDPGLFRYGKAFGNRFKTELGWGSQTTLLSLLSLPIAIARQAGLILYGSEFMNNEYRLRHGWKEYLSYDQTSFWTHQQNNMVRLLSGGNCSVKSMLEPIEEINIFSLLHKRYPELGRYQFSCSAESPLYKGSQWCHKCYKCARMYLFASCCKVDPESIGFRKNLMAEKGMFDHYFGDTVKSGCARELDFAFSILHRQDFDSPYVALFRKKKLKSIESWQSLKKMFTSIKPAENLPSSLEKKMLGIFKNELSRFKAGLPG